MTHSYSLTFDHRPYYTSVLVEGPEDTLADVHVPRGTAGDHVTKGRAGGSAEGIEFAREQRSGLP